VLAMAFTFSCGEGCYTSDGGGQCLLSNDDQSSSSEISSSSAPACNSWGSWIEITPATCDKEGVEIRICTSNPSNIEMQEKPQDCSAASSSSSNGSSSSSAPACNSWGSWIEITPSACDRKGVEIRICTGNPSNIEMQEKPQDCSAASSSSAPKCNSYGSWIETTSATCDKKGVETRICTNDPSIIEMQEKPQLEWSEWVETKAADGLTPAEGKRTCPNGQSETGSLYVCNGQIYADGYEFCLNGEVKSLCGGKDYGIDQKCEDGVIETKCGANWYNAATQFCQSGTNAVKDLCGTATYSATEGCCVDKVYSLTREHNGQAKTQFCDVRDSKTYVQVTISSQTWMAENLNYASGGKCGNGSTTSDGNTSTCNTYGRLYNWNTAISVCPAGWHLPSKDEWEQLLASVGKNVSGTMLKTKSGWEAATNAGNGNDQFGFSALPSGTATSDGSNFSGIGSNTYWWSATEGTTTSTATAVYLYNTTNDVRFDTYGRGTYFSVRCIKNN